MKFSLRKVVTALVVAVAFTTIAAAPAASDSTGIGPGKPRS